MSHFNKIFLIVIFFSSCTKELDYDLNSKESLVISSIFTSGESAKFHIGTTSNYLENTDEEKTWRLYSAESLGKIADSRAMPLLKKVFEENDPLVKAYSAKALAAFNMKDVVDILIQGLNIVRATTLTYIGFVSISVLMNCTSGSKIKNTHFKFFIL